MLPSLCLQAHATYQVRLVETDAHIEYFWVLLPVFRGTHHVPDGDGCWHQVYLSVAISVFTGTHHVPGGAGGDRRSHWVFLGSPGMPESGGAVAVHQVRLQPGAYPPDVPLPWWGARVDPRAAVPHEDSSAGWARSVLASWLVHLLPHLLSLVWWWG